MASASPLHRWLFTLSLAIGGYNYTAIAKQIVRDGDGVQLIRDTSSLSVFDSFEDLINGNLTDKRDARVIVVAQNGATSLNETVVLDIPAQSLETALYAFGAATGTEVFVDGNLLLGRRTNGVKGELIAAQALRVLLTDTELQAQTIGPHAITLSPVLPERSKTDVYRGFSAQLQSIALRRLCRDGDIDLGSYRIAMELWLNDLGSVQRVRLLSSTGDQSRDQQIQNLLQKISVGKLPPQLPQPVVMVILPRSGDCPIDRVEPPQSEHRDRRFRAE